MKEAELQFEAEIDGRFPYHHLDRCRQLVKRGIALSPRAAFAVLHEICRPPRSSLASKASSLQLLDDWRSGFDHPVASMVAEAAHAMIVKRKLSDDDVIARMQAVSEYPGLYPALDILYFSCEDADGRVEALRSGIGMRWTRS